MRMVGRKALAVVLCMLVLLSITVVALPFSPKLIAPVKPVEVQKEKFQPQQPLPAIASVEKSTTPFGKKQNNSPTRITPVTGLVPSAFITVSNGSNSGSGNNNSQGQQPNASQLCSTPGFACGGAPGSFVYGSGDAVHYSPHVTEGLQEDNSAAWWAYSRSFTGDYLSHIFELVTAASNRPAPAYLIEYPDFYGGAVTYFGDPSGGHPQEGRNVEYAPCITSAIEAGNFSSDWQPGDYGPNYVVQQTRGVISQCGVLQSQVYRSQCALSTSPAWAGQNAFNPYYPQDAYWLNPSDRYDSYILRSNAISRFGEYAWCDIMLNLDQPLSITVDSAGHFNASWRTDMLAANDASKSKLTFTPVLEGGGFGTPVIFTGTAASHVLELMSKDHSINGTLSPGTYKVNGTSCTFNWPGPDIRGDWRPSSSSYVSNCVADEGYPAGFKLRYSNYTERNLVVVAPLVTPVITFISPTPPDVSTQASNSVTISISSSVPLTAANVTLIRGFVRSTQTNYTMVQSSPTAFIVTISGLSASGYRYFVTATNGLTTITPTRTFTISASSPTVTFTSPPTPVNGASLASDSANIAISTSIPVSGATLHLTKPDGTTSTFALTETTPTTCTGSISGLRAGLNTYYVDAISTSGTSGTSSVQSFTVPGPSVSFTASTPASGSSQTATSATISITANEPLASAILAWTNPTGATTRYSMTSTSSTTFTYAVSSLSLGTHSYHVEAVDDEGDSATSVARTLIVSTVEVTSPVLTLVSPTPANGATLASDSGTVAITSSEALASATLHLTKPDGSTTDYSMASTSATAYRVALTGLRAGPNTYYVTAVDSDEGAVGTSATRTFTAPLPLVTFAAPTPANAASRPPGTPITVSVSSNEPLTSATLVWNSPSGTTQFTMDSVSSTSFTYTVTPSAEGAYSYRVDVVDDESDATTTETRSLTIATGPIVPPIITFVAPTPISGTTLANDALTVSISSNEPLASATLSLAMANGTSLTLPMTLTSTTTATRTVSDVYNGTATYTVNAVDTDEGASTITTARTAIVPITFLLHTFQGEGIGSMAVFGNYMYVGTFNETAGQEGHSHVYRSLDGITWAQVFTANRPWTDGTTITVRGVYAMTTYDDGTGNALYIGTGSDSASDGDIWRSYDGTTWTLVRDGTPTFTMRINRLTVIDGTLYAGASRPSGTGRVMWYNSTTSWDEEAEVRPVRGIGKFGSDIYLTADTQIFRLHDTGGAVADLGVNGQALSGYSGKFYAGVQSTNTSLYKSTDATTWTSEIIPDSVTIPNLRPLSDGYLYIPIIITDAASIWRRNSAEVNERVAAFGLNSDTGTNYDRTVDVVEFHSRKYTGLVDRFGSSGTNRWGYVFKLTN